MDVPKYEMEETVTYSDHSVYSFESDDATAPDTVTSDDFYLVNTLIQEASALTSIEVYGHQAGEIKLNLMRSLMSFVFLLFLVFFFFLLIP